MRKAMTGNTAEARIAWPLMPVKSSDSLPMPQPMKAILVAATSSSPSPNSRPHQNAMRGARPTSSHAKIAAAAGNMTTVSPSMVIFAQGIIKPLIGPTLRRHVVVMRRRCVAVVW
jgi:hypothetical protein